MRSHFLTPTENQSGAGRLIERSVLCFFVLMNFAIVYLSLTTSFNGWTFSQYALMVVYVSASILGCWLIMRTKASPARVLWEITFLSLAVRVFLVATIPTKPDSDFFVMYEAARSAAVGNFSWTHDQKAYGGYFYQYGYQIPFVLYEAVILWLFRSILALKLFNVLFMVGANYLLYRIGKLYLAETAALCVAFLYAILPDTLFYTTVLTNQHISLFFLLMGVLLLLRAERWWDFVLAGVSLTASDLMRPESVVILTAYLCCGALRCIQSPNLTTLKRVALSLVPVLVCYWLIKSLAEGLLVWTDIAPYGIQNRVPEWKFILGLGNVEGHGTWNADLEHIFNMDSAGRRTVTAELILNLLRRPIAEILDFFIGKLRVFWSNHESFYWAFNGTDPNLLILPGLELPLFSVANLEWCGAGMQMLVYLLALPTPLLLWKDGKRHGEVLFFVAVVCVVICVFLLIEIQPRYRLFVDPFWLLLDGVTLERLTLLRFPRVGIRTFELLRKE